MICPHCGLAIPGRLVTDPDPDPIPDDPPYDDAQDHVRCDDCRGTGRDPVYPTDRCSTCDGSGWT